MEFKTTTGGSTTLHLDPEEEAWLKGVAKVRKQAYERTFIQFELLRRNNPLADFKDMQRLFAGAGPVAEEHEELVADGLSDLLELDSFIRGRLKICGSMQVEAMLLQARATTLQAIALTQLLAAATGTDDE